MTYHRVYNWQNDRDAGIPISADRMDAEFDAIIADMNDLDTRIPTSGGGGGAGATAPTAFEWTVETAAATYVSGTSFKFTGVDLSGKYHAGRRVRLTFGAGPTVAYFSVVSSTYSGGNTTVVVAPDVAGAITSPVTKVEYGASYNSPAYLSPRSVTSLYSSGSQTVHTTDGTVSVQLDSELVDSKNEGTTTGPGGSGIFTARQPGTYLICAQATFSYPTGAPTCIVQMTINGTLNSTSSYITLPSSGGSGTTTIAATLLTPMRVGDWVGLTIVTTTRDITLLAGGSTSMSAAMIA